MNKRLLSLCTFLAISGFMQLAKGVQFQEMYLRWTAIAVLLFFSFFVEDKKFSVVEDRIFVFLSNIFSNILVFGISFLPTKQATEKRKNGYSNYYKRKKNE